MQSRHRSFPWSAFTVATLGIIAMLAALEPVSAYSEETKSLVLNAGETRVIGNLYPGSVPNITVITNPHALVVHEAEPGTLTLMGAEEGQWKIAAKAKTGQDVYYDVTVHSIKDWNDILKPGKAPIASNRESSENTFSTPGAVNKAADQPTAVVAGTLAEAGDTSIPEKAASALVVPPASDAGPPEFRSADPSMAPAQNVSEGLRTGVFKSDPSIAASGQMYSADGVLSSGGTNFLPPDGISIMTGTSRVYDFTDRLSRVSIANTDIADIQVITPYQLNLIAHKPGFTTVAVWMGKGHYEERQVRVDPGGKQQVMLHCVVAQLDRNRLENQGMNLQAALSSTGLTLMGLPGAVATPFSPQSQVTAQGPFGTTTSTVGATMAPGGSLTPFLLSQNLTYGLATQNGQWGTQTFFQYLENHQLAKILAQPNLLASSGQNAKFLSGGEIPIVITQALNTSIVFKEFGTKVVFLPTVVGVNDIELLVKPEVSEPDYLHGVQMFGFTIPAFVTRRAETMVRLRDGQTLIVAGLIQRTRRETIQKVPYLGDLPLAGGLFRNTAWENDETDLVMSVTPQIVRPLPPGAQVYSPPASRGELSSHEIRTTRLSNDDAGRPRF